MEMPPPGWYDDPVQTGSLLRWWDGTQWTGHTAPRVQALGAPVPATGEAPAASDPADLRDFPAADAADDQSLTEWFDSVPTRQEPGTAIALTRPAGGAHAAQPAAQHTARHGENSTRVLDGALMPPPPRPPAGWLAAPGPWPGWAGAAAPRSPRTACRWWSGPATAACCGGTRSG